MNRNRVLLTKTRPLACTGRRCHIPLIPYTTAFGATRYRPKPGQRHTSLCETRLWGHAVALGAPFATCEHTNDDKHDPILGGAA